MKKRKISMKVVAEMDVSFESYGNKKLDRKAISEIKRVVKDILDYHGSHLTLYVQKDGRSFIEDSTDRTKTTVMIYDIVGV